MDQILFLVFAVQAVVAAVLSVTRKNTVAAACWLVLMFFGLAGIYALMEAWFVAAIQILVYAGAIMVLFLFVVMLLNARHEEEVVTPRTGARVLGVLAAVVLLVQLYIAFQMSRSTFAVDPDALGPGPSSVRDIGNTLFTNYAFAFEVTSVLILVAMVGAVVIARREP
jgi:NADH-quinone oxidoreductase subunit J